MRHLSRLLALSLGLSSVVPIVTAVAESIPKQEASATVLSKKPFGDRFRLFGELRPLPPPSPFSSAMAPGDGKRLFHNSGDPDSLFTFGGPTPQGNLRLSAAFEVNDVVLRSIAPDLRVDPSDTRPRSSGDYRALDASGRPYQLRLGARLVW